MMIEASDKPFNWDRLLKYCKTILKINYDIERSLFPYEILDLIIDKIKTFNNVNVYMITQLLIDGLRNFFVDISKDLGK